MSEDLKQQGEALRQAIKVHFLETDLPFSGLLACIDAWEREPELIEQIKVLQAEKGKLLEQVKKLRAAQSNKDSGYMSSRLREALRE